MPLHSVLPFWRKLFTVELLAVAAALCVTGCGSRTYISSGDPGIRSSDGDTRLRIAIYGAPRRQYPEQSEKEVALCIKRGVLPNATILFEHSYKFVGADMLWSATWNSTNAVTLQLFDWGKGKVSQEDSATGNLIGPTNHIATLVFSMDKQTGKFVEERK